MTKVGFLNYTRCINKGFIVHCLTKIAPAMHQREITYREYFLR
jgi:hypothetical protein